MIVAVDFDGVLFEDAFPEIGAPNYGVISFVRQLIDEGHEVILWTSRAGDRLDEAVLKCHDYGLHFCSVNENAPSNSARYAGEYPTPSPKVYADLYLDDNDPWFQHCVRASNRRDALDDMIRHARRSVDVFVKAERQKKHQEAMRKRQEAMRKAREEIAND